MIEGSTHQEDITFVNIYVSNIEAPKYIKKILKDLKGKNSTNNTRGSTLHFQQYPFK